MSGIDTDVPGYDHFDPFQQSRTKRIENCIEAVRKGDLAQIKTQVADFTKQPNTKPAQLRALLSVAAECGKLDIAEYLLLCQVADGVFPSEVAVRARSFNILELFIKHGWDINEPISQDEPPVLSIPLSTPDVEVCRWLLDHGADPNKGCELDLTPTSCAMRGAPLEVIKDLFKNRGADPKRGQLLHHAVLRNKSDALDLVKWIVEIGAPFDEIKYEKHSQSYQKRQAFGLGTPLHRAAEKGKLDIINYLLGLGADPLKQDTKGHTARYWAKEGGFDDVYQVLEKAENPIRAESR